MSETSNEPTSIPRDEQETTISWMRDDDQVSIWTSNRVHLDRLRKLSGSKDYVTEVRGGHTWGDFRVRADSFYVFSAIREKRRLSDAERAARSASLERARAARAES